MQTERAPGYIPQEERSCAGKVQDIRERLQSGSLSELTPYPQFVVWKYTVDQGKLKKRPYNPRTHTAARTNDPSTWTSIEPSLKALATRTIEARQAQQEWLYTSLGGEGAPRQGSENTSTTLLVSSRTEGMDLIGLQEPEDEILEQPEQDLSMHAR